VDRHGRFLGNEGACGRRCVAAHNRCRRREFKGGADGTILLSQMMPNDANANFRKWNLDAWTL
jgi:hypothetical protein